MKRSARSRNTTGVCTAHAGCCSAEFASWNLTPPFDRQMGLTIAEADSMVIGERICKVLNLDGKVKSIHGPDIEIQNNSREAANGDGSVKSRLLNPYLCQEDNEGNVLICYNTDRLMLFTAECKWHDATPVGGLKWPEGAVWLNGRLYVSSSWDKSITMFE